MSGRAEKILVVDDSRTSRTALTELLAGDGYDVIEAADGMEAVAAARAEKPDMILLDVIMPGESGYDVCGELRSDDRFGATPILFLSGLTNAEDKIQGLSIGGDDYITKPFDPGETLARVRTHLRIRRLNLELGETNQALAELNEELLVKQARLDEDLKAAALVQHSLLPKGMPRFDGVSLAYTFIPSEFIGGDVLDIFRLDDRRLGMYLLDVSGHGPSAALITFAAAQALSIGVDYLTENEAGQAPSRIVPPNEVLTRLDREFPQERFGRYLTITYLIIDAATGRVDYCSGGHPSPILIRADKRIELLEEGGPIIGLGGLLPFPAGRVDLEPGDRLYVYTDGIVEQVNQQGEMFDQDRLVSVLTAHDDRSIQSTVNSVFLNLAGFAGTKRFDDDASLIGLEFIGAGV